MTEQEVRQKMQEGWAELTPKVADMTNLMMDSYQLGFKTCWKLLTGNEFQLWQRMNQYKRLIARMRLASC